MKTLTKTGAAVAVLTIAALALSGCSSRGQAGSTPEAGSGFAKGSLIGVALPQKTSENWVLAEKLFTEQIAAAGYKADVQFANAGVPEQQSQIEAMVTKNAKVVVVGAIDGAQLGAQLGQATDNGASVIAYDRLLTNTTSVDYFVSYDSYVIGQKQAESLITGLKAKDGEGPYTVELFAGSSDDANAKAFFDGSMNILQPLIDKGTIKIGSGQTTFGQATTLGWKPEKAQARMDSLWVSKYTSTKLDGILSPNDTIARALIVSAKNAGKAVPVITGQDSDAASVTSIMDGEQYSTINKDIRTQVGDTMKMIKALAAGKKPATTTTQDNGKKKIPALLIAPTVVTKENAAKVYANNPTLEPLTK